MINNQLLSRADHLREWGCSLVRTDKKPEEIILSENKYLREIKPGIFVDVYDVLLAFDVKCPALSLAITRLLEPGLYLPKWSIQYKIEAIASINRSIEIEKGKNP